MAVAAQSYALAFEGAGSITLSGAHSAVLSSTGARVVLIFTPAAGSLTLTVSGTVQAAQLEAGNCATSYIATTGSAASRACDELVLPLGPWWNEAEGTLLIEWADLNQQSGNTPCDNLAAALGIIWQAVLALGMPLLETVDEARWETCFDQVRAEIAARYGVPVRCQVRIIP